MRVFNISYKDEGAQAVNLKAGTRIFHADVKSGTETYSIGLKGSDGVWHNYDLSDQVKAGDWYNVELVIKHDFDVTEFSLLNNVGTAQVYKPMLQKGTKKGERVPNELDIEESATIKSASWEIHTSSPVIYKDAPDAQTAGIHTPVTVTGRHWVGSVMTEEGFLTATAEGGTEAPLASVSPIVISPANNSNATSYTLRLYSDAEKTELLDFETIPVVFKGARGIDAVRLHIDNPVDVIPANQDGYPLTLAGTGTKIHVFEGAIELDYDGVGTANGKFRILATLTGITMGAITDGGNVCNVGDATYMSSSVNKASVVYSVTGKTLDGLDFSLTGEQNFTKTKMGQDGDGILAVIDYYGVSLHESLLPSEWFDYVPTKNANQYLWNYERIYYSDSTYDETQARIIQGKDAKSIAVIANQYAYSTSETTSPTTGWVDNTTDLGEKPAGQFLWVREKITYTDATISYTAGYVVKDGDPVKMIEVVGNTSFKNPETGGVSSTFLEVVKHNFEGSVKWEYFSGSWQSTPWSGNITINYSTHSALFVDDILQLRCSSLLHPEVVATVSITVTRDGGDGEDGYSVSLPSEYSYNYDKNGNLKGLISSGAVLVEVLNGSTKLTCDSLGTMPPTVDNTYRVTGFSVGSGLTYNVDRPASDFRFIPTGISSDNVVVVLTIVARVKGENTSFIRQTTYKRVYDGNDGNDGNDGDDGLNGDGVVHIYKHSPIKPTKPDYGVQNPTGWTRNSDRGITIGTPTNWALKDKWYQSEELTASGNSAISVLDFTTTLPNQTITFELWADGQTSLDYVYAGKLNTSVTTSNYYDRVVGGRKVITYEIPSAGSHSIQFFWRKGTTTLMGSNRGYFAIIRDVKTWRSANSVIDKAYGEWSDPARFDIDSSTEEKIYILSKTAVLPLISDSDPYLDEYIPLPCTLANYRGDFAPNRAYSIGQVVVYSGSLYRIKKNVTTSYTGNPLNTEYFEFIKGYTDNPSGATKEYPFEFVAIRNKVNSLWGEWFLSSWVNYGESGRGVKSVVVWYYKSTSISTPTGGSWATSKPNYSESHYLWTKAITTYTDDSTTETTPILDPDWHKILAITDKFGTTIGGVGFDSGLISTVVMLLRELNSTRDTAGLSGMQGTDNNLPAFWAGGEYNQAVALISYFDKLASNQTVTLAEYNNLSRIALMHDGVSKLGHLLGNKDGQVLMVDPATGAKRLEFDAKDIRTVASLEGETQAGTSINVPIMYVDLGSPTTYSSSISVTKADSDIIFGSTPITVNATASAGGTGGVAEVKVILQRNGVDYQQLRSAGRYIPQGTNDVILSPAVVSRVARVPTGEYRLKFVNSSTGNLSSVTGTTGATTFSWSFSADVEYFQFGLNGMMSWWKDTHLYVSDQEVSGRAPHNKWNTPGVLLSATVGFSGGWDKVWGAKQSTSSPIRNSTGRYTVYHTIGHSNYQVLATPHTASRTCHIVSKGVNNFVIEWRTVGNSPSLADTVFDISVTGNNY